MKHQRVVVCDDEMLIRMWLRETLTDAGFRVEAAGSAQELFSALEREPADLVLLDLRLPDANGVELLPRLHALDPTLPVIIMTAFGEIETAMTAVRAGAFHFVEKPLQMPETLILMSRALETRALRGDVDRYRDGHRWQFAGVSLVGRSPALRRIAELVERVGSRGTTPNILIRGESGTGKDVVARAIHASGPRRTQPFVSVNCTSLPEHLFESELFGHERGSFTDAKDAKRGLFEIAHKGTVFLDEIGDMPKSLQAKLLQVLETQQFRRVGGVQSIEVDVHVLTATNRNLEEAVARGEFREDLFYRLNVVPIVVPPLRERPEDIGPLTLHFVETLCHEMRLPVRHVSAAAMDILEGYSWPGNARELRNTLERVLLLDDSPEVQPESLPHEVRGGLMSETGNHFILPAMGIDLEEAERGLISQALERAHGNKTAAARLLHLTRDTLRYRLEKFDLQ